MYHRVLRAIDDGEYQAKAAPTYEKLYQDAKQWSQAKLPPPMNIHVEGYQNPLKSEREVLELFTSKVNRKIPKFDPNDDK